MVTMLLLGNGFECHQILPSKKKKTTPVYKHQYYIILIVICADVINFFFFSHFNYQLESYFQIELNGKKVKHKQKLNKSMILFFKILHYFSTFLFFKNFVSTTKRMYFFLVLISLL